MKILKITELTGKEHEINTQHDMDKIEKILWNKHAYNSGHQGDFQSYTVYYTSKRRVVIPLHNVASVAIDSTPAAKEDAEADIGLGKAVKKESDIDAPDVEHGNSNANEQE